MSINLNNIYPLTKECLSFGKKSCRSCFANAFAWIESTYERVKVLSIRCLTNKSNLHLVPIENEFSSKDIEQLRAVHIKVEEWINKSEHRKIRAEKFFNTGMDLKVFEDDFGSLKIEEIQTTPSCIDSPLTNYTFTGNEIQRDLSKIFQAAISHKKIVFAAYDKQRNLQGVSVVELTYGGCVPLGRSKDQAPGVVVNSLITAYPNMDFNEPKSTKRSKHVGLSLLAKAIALSKNTQFVFLTASLHAVPFYVKLGFTAMPQLGTEHYPAYILESNMFSKILNAQSKDLDIVIYPLSLKISYEKTTKFFSNP